MSTGFFYQIYEMMADYIYGVDVVLTSAQDMTLTALSTIISLLIVAVPFVVVWRIIKLFL